MGAVNSCSTAPGHTINSMDLKPGRYAELEEVLNCPLCRDKFTDPRMLQCQHSFCCKCLEKYIKQQFATSSTIIGCPVCKVTMGSMKKFVEMPATKRRTYFPKNLTLSEILNRLPGDDKYCIDHTDKVFEYFCELDKVLCCSDCVLVRHKRCSKIVPVKEYSDSADDRQNARYASLCKPLVQVLNKNIEHTQTMLNQLKTNKEKLEKCRESFFSQLEEFKQGLLEEVEKHEKEIKTLVNDIIDTKYQEIDVIEEIKGNLSDLVNKLTDRKILKSQELLDRLRTVQDVDKLVGAEGELIAVAQNKFKTVNLEFSINQSKKVLVMRYLEQAVNMLLVTERSLY